MSDPLPLDTALAEGLHKAMCFETTMHNRLACPRRAVYLNLAAAALAHPAVTETLDVERRSASAAFGALSAAGDEIGRLAALSTPPPSRSAEELLATLEVGPDPVYWAGYRDGRCAALEGAPDDGMELAVAESMAKNAIRAVHEQQKDPTDHVTAVRVSNRSTP